MTAKQYASFILQTGLEFDMTVYCLNHVLCWSEDEAAKTKINREVPDPEWVEAEPTTVSRHNIFQIIEGWNVEYFPNAATAEQARKEFLEIIKIEDKEVRIKEYDNWIAERSGWAVGL